PAVGRWTDPAQGSPAPPGPALADRLPTRQRGTARCQTPRSKRAGWSARGIEYDKPDARPPQGTRYAPGRPNDVSNISLWPRFPGQAAQANEVSNTSLGSERAGERGSPAPGDAGMPPRRLTIWAPSTQLAARRSG